MVPSKMKSKWLIWNNSILATLSLPDVFLSLSLLITIMVLPSVPQTISETGSEVQNLEGEAGFRMASLKWRYPSKSTINPSQFQVRYCEKHAWGLHRCRYQTVENATLSRRGRQENSVEEEFATNIGGLRMATNYSFRVVAQNIPFHHTDQGLEISLQTKGFSAKATKCLADSSEVVVETGPHFGGRISVEDSTVPGCFIKGNANSQKTRYILRINHKTCGSKINGSNVTTVILVQENLPILTHSTRRFVVLCSFSPTSFTVKTGVSLPREISVAKSLDFSNLAPLSIPRSNGLQPPEDEATSGSRGGRRQHKSLKDFIIADKHSLVLHNQNQREFVDQQLPKLKRLVSSEDHGRSLEHKGTGSWETLAVFAMMFIIIVVSIGALGWFASSYYKIWLQERGVGQLNEIGETESSIGSIDNSSSSGSSFSIGIEDTEDVEVELDFEFSEDINNVNEKTKTQNQQPNE